VSTLLKEDMAVLVNRGFLVYYGCDGGVNRGQQFQLDEQLLMSSDPDTLLVTIATVVVPKETRRGFAATDFPSIIPTDYDPVICWIQSVRHNAHRPARNVDRIVRHSFAARRPSYVLPEVAFNLVRERIARK